MKSLRYPAKCQFAGSDSILTRISVNPTFASKLFYHIIVVTNILCLLYKIPVYLLLYCILLSSTNKQEQEPPAAK